MTPRLLAVTWNSRDELPGFLASLRTAGVRDDQLVVVDNASSDDTVDVVRREAPGATVLQTGRNAGYGAAINHGLRAIDDAAHVLVLNPDVRLRPGVVDELLRIARASDVGVVAPRLVTTDGQPAPSVRHDPTWWRTLALGLLGGTIAGRLGLAEVVLPPPRTTVDADWVTGATMLLTPRARAAVPAWEESYFLYGEEVDYCQRVRAADLRIVHVPHVEVEHAGGEMAASPRLWALRAVNWVLHARRTSSPVAATLFHAAAVLFELRRAASGHAPARAALRALLANDLLARRDALLPDDVDAPLAEPAHVVVPAHAEGDALATTLSPLVRDAGPGELDLLVVVNGSTDGTADVARAVVGEDRVVELAAASKVAAMRAADERLGIPDEQPVVYLDADVHLSIRGLRRLVRLVDRQDVEAAAPSPRYDLSTGSWPVRSYLRLWQHLPFTDDALSGTGAYALAPSARRRFDVWPDVVNDDAWINALVPRDRRRRAPDVRSDVEAPPTVAALIRRKVRVERGNASIRTTMPSAHPPTTWRDLAAIVRHRPRLLVDLPAFLIVTALHRLARRRGARADWA